MMPVYLALLALLAIRKMNQTFHMWNGRGMFEATFPDS